MSGVSVRRVIDQSRARVPEHAHDWSVLSLFVLGGYSNETELGERFIAGPSAVLYRARAAHRNIIAASGFEQIEIEFDPAWLACKLPDAPVSRWIGWHAGTEARALVQLCTRDAAGLRAALRCFFERRNLERERAAAPWVERVTRRLGEAPTLGVGDLAHEANLHPSWLGTAYRRATGEGLLETAARFRVERAARLLRETNRSLADIAIDAGFCDQSHMNRSFRRLLDRTPSTVRDERRLFRQPNLKATTPA